MIVHYIQQLYSLKNNMDYIYYLTVLIINGYNMYFTNFVLNNQTLLVSSLRKSEHFLIFFGQKIAIKKKNSLDKKLILEKKRWKRKYYQNCLNIVDDSYIR
ncbi:hypothetical protein KUTeg_001127 [Tegillarca granosa]|uniref:Transmembrane protein n=1 Tax=Tegillarca granosa TaxID=220873 RepID=A0ABQ9FVP3_TEGGR|nr:hypothetical protein KUTeg_001127 [Tegillarca granosa]